jgi:hypothetical protein
MVALSISNIEAVFSGTQFKTVDNVKTTLKLEVKEKVLIYRKIFASQNYLFSYLIPSITSYLIPHHTL